MTGLTIVFVVLGVVLIVPLYAFGMRRLLGLRLSPRHRSLTCTRRRSAPESGSSSRFGLYAFIGYCLLVFAGILALRVLVLVFRPAAD